LTLSKANLKLVEEYQKRWFWYRLFLPHCCMNCRKLKNGVCRWGQKGTREEIFLDNFKRLEIKEARKFGDITWFGGACPRWK